MHFSKQTRSWKKVMKRQPYERREILELYDCCVYCRKSKKLTVDHVVPASKGLEYGLSYDVIHGKGNLVMACRGCNQIKGCHCPRTFFERYPQRAATFTIYANHVDDVIFGLTGLTRKNPS